MPVAARYQHEDLQPVPPGYHVRTIEDPKSGHELRLAFPPGPRVEGSAVLVSVLHPPREKNCTYVKQVQRNPLDLLGPILTGIIGGTTAGIGYKIADEVYPRVKRALRSRNAGSVDDCTQNWKKDGADITDRAHRQRAQLCVPNGPAICQLCGSDRFPVVDHKDGDESNDAKSNLRWLCKSCNTRLGARDAAMGRGRRTHQYNPGGAATLGEYVNAAFRHERGQHDEGGAIIHATPKSRRSRYAHQIWKLRHDHGTASIHRNGGDYDAAAELSEHFHGRRVEQVFELQESHVRAGSYSMLGRMGALWLMPLEEDSDPNDWPKATIEWKTSEDVRLASDISGTQYYFMGGDQDFDDHVTGDWTDLGTVYGIEYRTEKSFNAFETTPYAHQFGEESGIRPSLWYCRNHQRLLLVGGDYRIASEQMQGASLGIEN